MRGIVGREEGEGEKRMAHLSNGVGHLAVDNLSGIRAVGLIGGDDLGGVGDAGRGLVAVLGGGHGEEGCCRGDNGGLHFEMFGVD